MPSEVAAASPADRPHALRPDADGDHGSTSTSEPALDSWTITVASESSRTEDADPFLARSRDWCGPLEPTLRDALTERIRDPTLARDLAGQILAVVQDSPLPRVLVRKQWRHANGSLHTLTVALRDEGGGVGECWYVDL